MCGWPNLWAPNKCPPVCLWETKLGLAQSVPVSVTKPALSRPAGFTSDYALLTLPAQQPYISDKVPFSEWSYQLHTFVGGAGAGSGCLGIKGILRIYPPPLARLAQSHKFVSRAHPLSSPSLWVGLLLFCCGWASTMWQRVKGHDHSHPQGHSNQA